MPYYIQHNWTYTVYMHQTSVSATFSDIEIHKSTHLLCQFWEYQVVSDNCRTTIQYYQDKYHHPWNSKWILIAILKDYGILQQHWTLTSTWHGIKITAAPIHTQLQNHKFPWGQIFLVSNETRVPPKANSWDWYLSM